MSDLRAPAAAHPLPIFPRGRAGVIGALLLSTLVAPATAQTWTGAQGGAFGDAANWTPQSVPDSAHDAAFGAGAPTALTLANSQFSVAGLEFAANAPAFTLTLSSSGGASQSLTIGKDGIVNRSNAMQQLIASDPNTALLLLGARASVTGPVEFEALATFATLSFGPGTNAGSAVIVNSSGGETLFNGASAASAHISVNAQSQLSFVAGAQAGAASIENAAQALTTFNDTSAAASAHISNAGEVLFAGSSSAGGASLQSSGLILFANGASAGSATIVSQGVMQFQDSSSAGRAQITNRGMLSFSGLSSLGSALVENAAGGILSIAGEAQGALARIVQTSGATLDVSGVSAASLSLGSLSGAGQLDLGRTTLILGTLGADDSFAGSISGSGATLIKSGSGQLTLSGDASFGGSTVVARGSLILDGMLDSEVSIQDGARLAGGGVLTGSLSALAGATLASAPGKALTVSGDVLLAPGSTLAPTLSAEGTSGSLSVSGTATIAGARLVAEAPAPLGQYAPGERFIVLSAAQGVDGEFESLTTDLAYFDPAVLYRADSVLLELRQPQLPFEGGGETPNQKGLGPVVIGLPGLGTNFMGLTPGAARALLDQLDGAQYSDLRRADLDLASGFTREVAERSLAAGGFGEALPSGRGAPLWIDEEQLESDAGGDANGSGYRYETRGLIAGAEWPTGTNMHFGVAANLAHTDFGFGAAAASGVADRWDVALEARDSTGPWSLIGVVSVGGDHDHLARSVAWPSFTENHASELDALATSALAEVGYHVGWAGLDWVPFASWQWVGAAQSGFEESMPGAAALSGERARASESLFTLGTRWGQTLQWGPRPGWLDASVGLVHETGPQAPLVQEAFLSDPAQRFSVVGPYSGANWLRAALALDAPVAHRVSVEARLFTEVSAHVREEGLYLGGKLSW